MTEPKRARSRLVSPAATAMHVRDVPASCICLWEWDARRVKWHIVKLLPGCPWHEGG